MTGLQSITHVLRTSFSLILAVFLTMAPNAATGQTLQDSGKAKTDATAARNAEEKPQGPKDAKALSADRKKDPDPDAESPDIPSLGRDFIDEGTYLRLRDEHVAVRRGIPDLKNNVHARSRAIREMERGEQALRKQLKAPHSASLSAFATIPSWTPLGPDPIPNGQTTPTLVPVSGRVTSIAIDQTDTTGNTVYVGTAQGGLYRTLDGGATWTGLMDSAQSLAIGAIAIDPMNHNTLFVGTGEGNLSGDSFFGAGVYVITNATTTANLAGPFNAPTVSPNPDGFTDVFTGRSITQILVNPANDNQILVATTRGFSGASFDSFTTLPTLGVYFSTNALSGSPTFTRSSIQTAFASRQVTDMIVDPGNANTILVHVFGLAAAGDGGIWMSTSGNPWTGTATWTQEFTDQSVSGRFAVNRVGGATTFLLTLNQTATCNATTVNGILLKSTGGVTWNELTAARGFCALQCFYDSPVAIDPTTVNNIYIGGAFGSGPGACGTGPMGKSTNGGTSFSPSQNSLHADSHSIAILNNNPSIVYTGNDGGIFKSIDGGATWTSRNTAGFNATQFESLSVHPTDPFFTMGGTQDNGTNMMTAASTWVRSRAGDGGFSGIDQNATNTTNVTMYHTFFNQTNSLIGYESTNAGANAGEGSWTFSGCTNNVSGNGITCGDTVLFYAPLTLGPGSPNTVYFGSDRLYRSADSGSNNVVVSQAPFVSGVAVSAIGISPQDDNVRIVGLRNGRVFATSTGANPMTDVTGGWPAKYVARAVIDPSVKTTAYITLDGYGTTSHIWKTTNLSAATPAWTAIGFNVDVPVNAFVVDPGNSSFLYAGTDIGVFLSRDGGVTWNPYGTGLPRVAVFDMKIVPSGHKLRIGTHGRGAWEIPAANQIFTLTVSSQGTGSGTVTSNDGSINCGATCSADFDAGTMVTLTATPAGGSVFGGWSGACSGTQTCMVTMNAAQAVTATFNPQPQFTLTVNKQGTGTGTVTSNDGSINCGGTCSASFNSGTMVTLTAIGAPGSVFGGWGGACSSFNTATCTVTMNAAQTASATFTLVQPTALFFVPVTPCRVADTRNPNGLFGGPLLGANTTRAFNVPQSACSIPAAAQAYSINVTVVPKNKLAFLTMFPCGQNLPLASTLNSDGRIKAAAAIVPAGTNGGACAFTTDDTDFVMDINGYFVTTSTPSSLAFYQLSPCRVVDTRNSAGSLGGPAMVGNATRTFPVLSSSCNIPNTAQAYSLNYTAVPQGKLSFLTTWPAGQTQPLVSTLNAPTGTVTANAAIVPAGTNGDVNVFVTENSNLVIDINGYFAPPATGGLSLFPLTPCRALDTRNPAGSPPFTGKRDVDIKDSGCGATTSAQAYVLNATVVPAGPLDFLTLWPQGATQPLVSTLNASDAAITSNLAIVPTTNGSISGFVPQGSHLVLDISGFFAP